MKKIIFIFLTLLFLSKNSAFALSPLETLENLKKTQEKIFNVLLTLTPAPSQTPTPKPTEEPPTSTPEPTIETTPAVENQTEIETKEPTQAVTLLPTKEVLTPTPKKGAVKSAFSQREKILIGVAILLLLVLFFQNWPKIKSLFTKKQNKV